MLPPKTLHFGGHSQRELSFKVSRDRIVSRKIRFKNLWLPSSSSISIDLKGISLKAIYKSHSEAIFWMCFSSFSTLGASFNLFLRSLVIRSVFLLLSFQTRRHSEWVSTLSSGEKNAKNDDSSEFFPEYMYSTYVCSERTYPCTSKSSNSNLNPRLSHSLV